jgi:hypothetical protein
MIEDHFLEEKYNLICKSLFTLDKKSEQIEDINEISLMCNPNNIEKLKNTSDISDDYKKITIHYNVGEKHKYFNIEIDNVEDKLDVIEKLVILEETYIKLANKIITREEELDSLHQRMKMINFHLENLKESTIIS